MLSNKIYRLTTNIYKQKIFKYTNYQQITKRSFSNNKKNDEDLTWSEKWLASIGIVMWFAILKNEFGCKCK